MSSIFLVTGANRGIGLEICRQLAKARPLDAVILTARDLAKGQEALSKLRPEGLVNVHALPCDVSVEEDAAKLAARVKEQWGRLDVLINNAGYAFKGSALDREIAERTLGTNFFGVRFVTHALLPLLSPGARVVNVSSGVGSLDAGYGAERRKALLDPVLEESSLCGMMKEFIEDVGAGRLKEGGWPASAYAVSKAGLNMLTRIWARDWEAQGRRIWVGSVCPGWVRTDMGGPHASRGVDMGAETPVWMALTEEALPNGRFYRDKAQIGW